MDIEEQIQDAAREVAREEMKELLDNALHEADVHVNTWGILKFHRRNPNGYGHGPEITIDDSEIPPDVRALMRLRAEI